MRSVLHHARSALIDARNLLETVPSEIRELAGPTTAWRKNERFEKRFLIGRGLRPEHYLLDIGCGPLRGGLPLVAYLQGGHYYGFDISPLSIKAAERRLERRGLVRKGATLWASSVDGVPKGVLPEERLFDYMLAFSVFIHLDDTLLPHCLDLIRRHLAPTGVCFANVDVRDRTERRWRDFPSKARNKAVYEELVKSSGLALEWLTMKPWERKWWFRHEVMVITHRGYRFAG